MKLRLTIGIGALLLLAFIVLWRTRENQSAGGAEPDAASPDSPAEEEDLAVRDHKGSRRRQPVAPLPARTAEGERPSEAEALVEQAAQTEPFSPIGPPVRTGPLSVLRSAYDTESADATSGQAERELRDLFGTKDLPDEYLYSVSCHRTVCKLKMLWSKRLPTVHMALVMTVIQYHRPATFAFDPVSEPDSNGDVTFEAYVTREGYTIDDLK